MRVLGFGVMMAAVGLLIMPGGLFVWSEDPGFWAYSIRGLLLFALSLILMIVGSAMTLMGVVVVLLQRSSRERHNP